MKHNLQEPSATPQTIETQPPHLPQPQMAKTPSPQITPPPLQITKMPPPPQQQQQQQQQQQPFRRLQMEEFVFKHPFTPKVSGPTSFGKTHLVKTTLDPKTPE